ncbi:MAG: hypothetical protein LUC34_01575 [Campylobacter sp.]|nr:hypothetical protein [Campylobacter sp.]
MKTKFKNNQKGVVALEVAMLFLPFFLLIAVIIEGLILLYKISAIDYIVDNVAKENATITSGFTSNFKENLEKRADDFNIKINDETSEISIGFCKSVKELADDVCGADETNGFVIAKYTVKYKIEPIFISLRTIGLVSKDELIISNAVYAREVKSNQ